MSHAPVLRALEHTKQTLQMAGHEGAPQSTVQCFPDLISLLCLSDIPKIYDNRRDDSAHHV